MGNLSEEKLISKYGHETISLDSEDIEKLLQGKELYNTDFDEYSFSIVAEEPVPLIPLAKIKQAREDIDKLDTKIAIRDTPQGRESYFIVDQAEVLKILDKLIEESEG